MPRTMPSACSSGNSVTLLLPHRADDRADVLAVDVLHRDEVRAVDLPDVEDLDDVGVRERRGDARLVEQHVDERLVLVHRRQDALDDDELLEARDERCRARKSSAIPPAASLRRSVYLPNCFGSASRGGAPAPCVPSGCGAPPGLPSRRPAPDMMRCHGSATGPERQRQKAKGRRPSTPTSHFCPLPFAFASGCAPPKVAADGRDAPHVGPGAPRSGSPSRSPPPLPPPRRRTPSRRAPTCRRSAPPPSR